MCKIANIQKTEFLFNEVGKIDTRSATPKKSPCKKASPARKRLPAPIGLAAGPEVVAPGSAQSTSSVPPWDPRAGAGSSPGSEDGAKEGVESVAEAAVIEATA